MKKNSLLYEEQNFFMKIMQICVCMWKIQKGYLLLEKLGLIIILHINNQI